MTQPDEQPTALNRAASLVLELYVHRLHALAIAVREGCDAVFSAAPVPEKDGYITVSPAIHARIDGVLVDAANIRKLVHTPPAQGKSESARVFRFRRERTRLIAEFLDGVTIAALLDAQVRNSLEHFDEYLDKLGAKVGAGEQPPQPVAAFNMVFSSWSVAKVAVRRGVYPIRVYVSADRTYYNFERKVNLAALRDEAGSILTRIEASGVLKHAPEPGGLMIVFPPV